MPKSTFGDRIDTDYLIGYSLSVPYDAKWYDETGCYERDAWAVEYLKSKRLPVHGETHLGLTYSSGTISGAQIVTVDYKPELFDRWIRQDPEGADFWRSQKERAEVNMKNHG